MAEGLLRHRLETLSVPASVSSAGLLSDGQGASIESLDLLRERGIEMAAHRSRLLAADWLRRADVVLAMARMHLREAVVQAPDAWPRTFTLKDLVRRGTEVGVRSPGEEFGEWLARVHEGRSMADYMGDSPADDVDDPIGGPKSAYERMVDEVEGLIDHLVELVWACDTARHRHETDEDRRSP